MGSANELQWNKTQTVNWAKDPCEGPSCYEKLKGNSMLSLFIQCERKLCFMTSDVYAVKVKTCSGKLGAAGTTTCPDGVSAQPSKEQGSSPPWRAQSPWQCSSWGRMVRILLVTYSHSSSLLHYTYTQYDNNASSHHCSHHYQTTFHTAKQLSNYHFSCTEIIQEREGLPWRCFSVIQGEEKTPDFVLWWELWWKWQPRFLLNRNSHHRTHLALLAIMQVEVKLKHLWKLE